ncbi:MAG: hypothetical protein IPM76_10960 [Chloroflexi bacterium]|nr:hypothetical protein [Chloroflexota bacterium]
MLDEMKCICGRPFAEHGPEHQQLLSLMQRSVPSSLEDDVLNTTAILTSFADKNSQQQALLSAHMRKRTELIDIIRDLDAELDDVSRQLKGSPLEEISRLEDQRRDFMSDIDGYNLEIGARLQKIEQAGKDISNLEKEK